MKNNLSEKLERMDGRTYTLGREGHIYMDSPTVSKQHAETSIADGKIFLRDLNSTNGTFLKKNKTLVKFDQGFVNPLQPIVIGEQTYVIQDLLAVASDFVAVDDNETLIEHTDDTGQRLNHG